ncbi:hypothetical protein DFJ73DRAFT_36691 [Zopfochytrium polystomum]|nr:hypothetical protein DFJ73DRAFT_36691 [Zopfochytrium polystomum]
MHDAIYEDHLANVEPAKFRWNFEESSSQAPWRAPLLQALSLCKGITHVGLRETDVPMQVVDLLGVMPQLVWLDLGRQNPSVSAAQWAVLLGPHLPAIRTIHMLGFNIPIFPIPGPLPENTIAALTAYATSMHTLEAWDNWGWSILINRDNAGPHFEKVDRPSAKRRIFDLMAGQLVVASGGIHSLDPSQPKSLLKVDCC